MLAIHKKDEEVEFQLLVYKIIFLFSVATEGCNYLHFSILP